MKSILFYQIYIYILLCKWLTTQKPLGVVWLPIKKPILGLISHPHSCGGSSTKKLGLALLYELVFSHLGSFKTFTTLVHQVKPLLLLFGFLLFFFLCFSWLPSSLQQNWQAFLLLEKTKKRKKKKREQKTEPFCIRPLQKKGVADRG